MKVLLILLASMASMAWGKCPAEYTKHDTVEFKVDAVNATISAAESCNEAVELIKVCAFMIAEYDEFFIGTAIKICDEDRPALSDEGQKNYKGVLGQCVEKYKPEAGASDKDKNFKNLEVLFCQLGVAQKISNGMKNSN